MEKVIMPRMETFKQALFTRRVGAYNETFAPLASFNDHKKRVFAVLMHKGIAGRKQKDIVSTYHQFFLYYSDTKHIVLWVENCFNQNKNWCLITYLVYIVNSPEYEIEIIDVYFLAAGHTFM